MEKYRFSDEALAALEMLQVPLVVYQSLDKLTVAVAVSQGFRDLLEYDSLEEANRVMEGDLFSNTHPDDAARVAEAARRFIEEGENYEVIYRFRRRRSGDTRIIHAIGRHAAAEDGTMLAYVWYTDEGEYTPEVGELAANLNKAINRALHEESLLQRSYFDYLTGLPSMTHFFELAAAGRDRLLSLGGTPALLFIDLSGMKGFNSKYGFSEGDVLLRAFSQLLIRRFGRDCCSRFGQDHFAVVTKADDLEERLSELFRETAELNGGRTLPLRVGIQLYSKGVEEISAACDRAKIACDLGRNTYVSGFNYYDERLQEKITGRQYILENLDRALAERWIKVYYQPIVRNANGQVSDEEALARWIDPDRGLLPPSEFIPVLEDSGLIYKLDLYMIDRVLEELKRKREAGLVTLPVSVNLSRVDFDACDIVEEVRRRVDDAGLSRKLITIEITESVVGSNLEFIKSQIDHFHALGFRVWMDDFGSGYSSLDVLQSIRFDVIKFDIRFMQQFDSSKRSRIVLTELAKMAMGMDIETVVEGVETRDQLDFITEVGCTKAQGYYYRKPNPLEEILERTRKGEAIRRESPDEEDYYAAIGAFNLYDPSVIMEVEDDRYQSFFDAIPMAIIEKENPEDRCLRILRCNASFRSFMGRVLGVRLPEEAELKKHTLQEPPNGALKETLARCSASGNWVLIGEKKGKAGYSAHAFVRQISANPISGAKAYAVAALTIPM